MGNGLGVGGKVYRKLGGRTFVNMSGTLQFARGGTRPAFSCSLGNYLDKHTGTAAFPDPYYQGWPAFSCSVGNYLDKHTGTAA